MDKYESLIETYKSIIDIYKEEYKQLKARVDAAIELLSKGVTFCENDSQGAYDVCNSAINREKKAIEILRGGSDDQTN